jgi:hypothetical protein
MILTERHKTHELNLTTIYEHSMCLHIYLRGEKLVVNEKMFTFEYLMEHIKVWQHQFWVKMRSTLFHRKAASCLSYIGAVYFSLHDFAYCHHQACPVMVQPYSNF